MDIFLVSDIFGCTPALDIVCKTLPQTMSNIQIIDPVKRPGTLNPDPALKHQSGRTCLENMVCFFVPADVKVSAIQVNDCFSG